MFSKLHHTSGVNSRVLMSWYVRAKTAKSNFCRPAKSEGAVWTASSFNPWAEICFLKLFWKAEGKGKTSLQHGPTWRAWCRSGRKCLHHLHCRLLHLAVRIGRGLKTWVQVLIQYVYLFCIILDSQYLVPNYF